MKCTKSRRRPRKRGNESVKILRTVHTLDGMKMIYSDEHAGLFAGQGQPQITRASHVEPDPNGDGWIADMAPVGGPILGPFPTRAMALAAETCWLEAKMFGTESAQQA